ncbi:MAG TPA: oligosaccharide flippase family protein [Candidatus Sulfotelmatobacter sp.]|nr:oligosaccharide flippase family protein [Candidatus Sulfotelmatobacter sp.]
MKDPAAKVDVPAGLSEGLSSGLALGSSDELCERLSRNDGVSDGGAPAIFSPPVDNQDAATTQTQQFRSQVGHISRQSGVFFAGTVFAAAFGYVFKVYLARTLGPEALGIFALGITLVGLLGVFNTLGLPQSAVRFVASYCASEKFEALHALLWRGAGILLAANVFFAALLLTFGRWVAIRVYHSTALVRYLPWFALIMLFSVLSGFYGKVLAGYKDLGRRTLIVNFIGSPLTMLVAVFLIFRGFGLRGYLVAQIVSAAVVTVLLFVAVREMTPTPARFSARPGAGLEKQIWTFSGAMLGIGFLEFLMVQADKIALGFYRGPREVGIYSVAAALVVYVPLVLSSINQIFSPTIAELHTRSDHAMLARLFQSLTKWVVGLTLPLAGVVIVFARPLMRIFGSDFEAGWPVLVIGTVGQLVNCGVGSVGYLLLMSGNEKRLIKVQAVMTIVMVGLNIALVPWLGSVGAATAAAATNVGINLWNLVEVRKALGLSPYNRSYIRLVIPALAMLAATVLLRINSGYFGRDWIAAAAAFVLAYTVFAASILVVGLDADDRLIATAIWYRVRAVLGKAPTTGFQS